MHEEINDLRKYLGCCGCWGREYTIHGTFICLFGMFDKNRPDSVPRHILRYQLSGRMDRESLMNWRCEYRYSKPEIDLIRSGCYHDENMTPEHVQKLMSIIRLAFPLETTKEDDISCQRLVSDEYDQWKLMIDNGCPPKF